MKKDSRLKARELKHSIYKEMASVTKALSNPHRLEIVDLLAQGPAPVEYISEHTSLSIANASQHLQVLKHSGLASTERKGKYIYYRLSNEEVYEAWCALRRLGFSQNQEISILLEDFRSRRGTLQTISSDELTDKMERDEVILLDVRPEQEYNRSHITNARSCPVPSLNERLPELSKEKEIIAYCRGPLCLMADRAVQQLQSKGYRASRLEEGFPEWKAKGKPVDSGEVEK
jgi:rhodanese-related sulfurtransferase